MPPARVPIAGMSARASDATDPSIALSDVLSALSYALDLTEGQPPGHTNRTCVIGMRLGDEIGLSADQRTALYFALLLKDAGCSSNAAKMAALFGSDDQLVKQRMKFVDWHRPAELALRTAQLCGVGQSTADRVKHFLDIARTEHVTRDIMQIRCDRGADIALGLGFPGATAAAIRALDEHWCGLGHPSGLRGEDIPLLARIANIAQTVDVFYMAGGVDAALRVVRARRGRWFDPKLSSLVLGWKKDRDFWQRLDSAVLRDLVLALEPGAHVRRVDAEGLDAIARSFAEIIDAKSPYTARHSLNVAAYARQIAARLGYPAREQQRIYRAGLLHDIGKLGVSNRILDKPGRLDPAERVAIEQHPRFTWEILQRVDAFSDFAWLAAVHHEKLDGSGYPWGLGADQLDEPSRILAVADIYEALSADRPYRAGMPYAQAMDILKKESGTKLCANAVSGLELAADALGG
jgi:putative nucleotidyltransferase with HDIG domain